MASDCKSWKGFKNEGKCFLFTTISSLFSHHLSSVNNLQDVSWGFENHGV